MPLATPNPDETEKDFISRCMADEVMLKEYPDEKQRAAVCHSQWGGKTKTEDVKEEPKPKSKPVMIPAERSEKECVQSKMVAAPIVEGKVAELDPGWVEGYAAVFGNVDLDGDRIIPGAFTRTIRERVPASKVKLMAVHYKSGGGAREVIGTVTQAKEDDYGLWMHAVLSKTRTAQEIRQNIVDGHIGHFSIGYVTKDAEVVELDGKAVQDLRELAWYETTVTTIPVNELAIVTNSKTEAVLEKAEPENADDSVRAKLKENRDAIEGKAAEMNLLVAERMELLDPEAKAEDTDTDAATAAPDTVEDTIAKELSKMKLELDDIRNAP